MAPDNAAEDWVWLGKRLRESRLRLQLTNADVAAAVGIAPNTVTAWEKGKSREVTEPLIKMAVLYGWPEGAIDRVLAGGMPHDPPPFPTTREEMRAIQRRLEDGDGTLTEPEQALLAEWLRNQLRDEA